MIEFKDVSFGYGLKKDIIHGLSLQIPDGGRVCAAGRSGHGKTTLLRLLMGLERPRHGEIRGTEGKSFSSVFQEDRLIGSKTVLQNISMFSDQDTARRMLEKLGLAGCGDMYPGELSGGMKRRAALARALSHPFDILVLDEAFTGLDGETKDICIAAVNEAAQGKTLVMATHEAAEAEKLGAEIFNME